MAKKIKTVGELQSLEGSKSFYIPFNVLFLWGGVIFAVMSILGWKISSVLIEGREEALVGEVNSRIEVLAKSRADLLSTWVMGLTQVSDHITKSDFVRLFATDVNTSDGQFSKSQILAKQQEYMRVALNEYAQQNGLIRASMVDAKGRIYLSSLEGMTLNRFQQNAISSVVNSGEAVVLPLNISSGELVVDVMKPIKMLGEKNQKSQVVGVLLSVFKISKTMQDLMSPGDFMMLGESAYLMQNSYGRKQFINLSPVVGIISQPVEYACNSYGCEHPKRYVYMAEVDNSPFYVVQEYSKASLKAKMLSYIKTVKSITWLLVITVALVLWVLVAYLTGTRNRQRVAMQQQSLNALVRAVEIRDPYLQGHYARVAKLSLTVAENMHLSVVERTTLYYAAMLSGIGKIFITQKTLTKPSALTPKEIKEVQTHIDKAMLVLKEIDFNFPVADVIYQMYERLDGSGYPKKVKGKNINKLSLVLGLCDAYCAMTNPRSHRNGMAKKKVLDIISSETDKFDLDTVVALKEVL